VEGIACCDKSTRASPSYRTKRAANESDTYEVSQLFTVEVQVRFPCLWWERADGRNYARASAPGWDGAELVPCCRWIGVEEVGYHSRTFVGLGLGVGLVWVSGVRPAAIGTKLACNAHIRAVGRVI
jgi:hypothetical protein